MRAKCFLGLLAMALAAACATRKSDVHSRDTAVAVRPAPARAPAPAPSLRCQRLLNVTLRPSAVGDQAAPSEAAMRAATDRVLAPIEPVVVKVDVSPAIRAFRVQLSDTATIDRVAARIRSSASVEDVSPDDCSMHVQRPASPLARSR